MHLVPCCRQRFTASDAGGCDFVLLVLWGRWFGTPATPPLAEVRGPIAGKRKYLTVLCADLQRVQDSDFAT
jgi:hypothetical protein